MVGALTRVTCAAFPHAQIFTRTCDSTRKLALMLRNLGFGAVPIHGQMSQPKRLGALNKFKAGKWEHARDGWMGWDGGSCLLGSSHRHPPRRARGQHQGWFQGIIK